MSPNINGLAMTHEDCLAAEVPAHLWMRPVPEVNVLTMMVIHFVGIQLIEIVDQPVQVRLLTHPDDIRCGFLQVFLF